MYISFRTTGCPGIRVPALVGCRISIAIDAESSFCGPSLQPDWGPKPRCTALDRIPNPVGESNESWQMDWRFRYWTWLECGMASMQGRRLRVPLTWRSTQSCGVT